MSKESAQGNSKLNNSERWRCNIFLDSCPGYLEFLDLNVGLTALCLIDDQPDVMVFGQGNWGNVVPKDGCPRGYGGD